jgi:hypothetical protein
MANAGARIKALVEAASGKADVSRFFSSEEGKQIAASQAAWREEYPDIQWKLDNVVEEGEHVGIHYTATGTHKESGKKLTWTGSAIARVQGNQFQLVKVHEDYLARLIGLGRLGQWTLDNPQNNITGNWTGNLFGIQFNMPLQQTPPSTAVSGTLSALGSSIPLTGTNTPPSVNLGGNTPKGAVTFVGTWASENQINGTLNGAGFNNQPVTFNR